MIAFLHIFRIAAFLFIFAVALGAVVNEIPWCQEFCEGVALGFASCALMGFYGKGASHE